MKATATAHPIQGLVKYHGIRDPDLRTPYHDSISLCTAPSNSTTTVAFEPDRNEDTYVIDGDRVDGRGAERIRTVVDHVRERAGIDHAVRMESENNFPTNVGFGSSASGFAALATALVEATDLELTHPEISTIARRGSTSAARAVTGGFSDLRAGSNDADCRSERLDVDFEDDVRIVGAVIPAYKETEAAHAEAEDSHMFQGRLAHVHEQLADMRDALGRGDFERTFEIAEHDTLSLAATTMTGPSGWVYWQPESLAVFETVRNLRSDGVPVYFSGDTGASIYINTTAEHVDQVESTISDLGIETRVWRVGGPARVRNADAALF
ncbi:phosphomevalonate decarboxylase MvaD [Halorhabdus rudnickae]|uniref:phosphomevalonate decarboxylase MvaD n=1 Tax=Halorhabdus rudnickae TaxID=1775544 RepID=UPI001084663D|nr:phosphomevalonate decarboxylase MvaD [Halorhabdus rudnickae]